LRQIGVDLDGGDAAARADDFGQDGAAVASAGADMDDILATCQIELIEHGSPQAGLAVVEALGLVDRDQNVVMEMRRIVPFRRPVIRRPSRAEGTPRPRAAEMLACDRGESVDHRTLRLSRRAASRRGGSAQPQFRRGGRRRP
jgi:hypothetical protein